MNIILIGMRGSGKSTIATLLAKKMTRTFYDLDSLLVEKKGMSIPAIIQHYGWEYFRDKESGIVEEIAERENAIIATGGGVVLRQKNIDILKKNGRIVYLQTTLATMLQRIGEDTNRPALTNKKSLKEEIEQILKERKNLYQQAADLIIETDKKTPKEIVDEIIKQL